MEEGQLRFKRLCKEYGMARAPDGHPNAELYALMHNGQCMTCEGQLKETTLTVIDALHGVVAVYCSGVCMTDMMVMGFLQEAHDDLVQRINFRGGKAMEDDDG